jgi:bacteriophage N4 adsorption protein B
VSQVFGIISTLSNELLLFAALGFAIGGLDDFAVDLLWIGRSAWRRLRIYRHHDRTTAATLKPANRPGRLVIFIPAWQEAEVIGDMLKQCLKRWEGHDYRIYVGCYPNDPATRYTVLHTDTPYIRLVDCPRPGPTTKADCLNAIWAALMSDEKAECFEAKAIILHDAEDLVHEDELTLFQSLIERFDMIQIPVEPLPDVTSRWIAGHYLDEFAEAHGKDLIVREAIGSSLPSAGVGCAVSRRALAHLATRQGGLPFDTGSLTEDYELGLKLSSLGYKGAFVRLLSRGGDGLVAVKAHFPGLLDEAVRQKTRWILGIALAGWDRMGWRGGLMECWMRLRDRRTIISALVLTCGYASLVIYGLAVIAGFPPPALVGSWSILLPLSLAFFVWRACIRFVCVVRLYGWQQGVLSLPRVIIGNIIVMMASRRAVVQYLGYLESGALVWDKTRHAFPAMDHD